MSQVESVALKPCPFCGDEAQPAFVGAGGIEWGQVECVNTDCGAVGPTPATEAKAITAWNTRIEDTTPTDEGQGVEHKPWHETDAHRDLSRIIPDMEGKISEAETKYAHCLPDHLFSPLKASITELRVLRHELAHPTPDTGLLSELVEALETAYDAINGWFRYLHGGEMRGSYDGKPERDQLLKAGYTVFGALAKVKAKESDRG